MRKYSEIKLLVKSSPFLGRGKGIFSSVFGGKPEKVEHSKVDVRNKPCPPGYYPERDGCIAAKEKQPQANQTQQTQNVSKPVENPKINTREELPKTRQTSTTETRLPKIPSGNLGKLDTNKIQEQPKPSVDDVLENKTQSKWQKTETKFNEKLSNIDEKAFNAVMPEGMTKESCSVLTGLDADNPNAVIVIHAKFWGDVPKVTLSVADDTVGLKMTRKIKAGGIVENESFEVSEDFQGQGIGTEIFSRQVETLVKAGMKKIQCEAAGSKNSTFNGYYTWPRLGYDADIEDLSAHSNHVYRKVKDMFPEAKTIQDLYKTKEGREWWKQNGTGMEMEFDLTEGSLSRKILAAYMEERQNRQKRLTLMKMKKLPWKRYGIS